MSKINIINSAMFVTTSLGLSKVRCSTLGCPIEFKHLVVLNLIVLGQDNTSCVLLVNQCDQVFEFNWGT